MTSAAAQNACTAGRKVRVSIAIPAFHEEANLPVLYGRIAAAMAQQDVEWELVIVDDHSGDNTFGVGSGIAAQDPRVSIIRLSRNCGSLVAAVCALAATSGDCAVVMAADLQDPPEMIPAMMESWREGAQVVWAQRERREGESASTLFFSQAFYFIMRRFVGIQEISPKGADFCLLDRRVVNALGRFRERNINLMALITWMGFRQVSLPYDKQARLQGRSGWTIDKKVKLAIDSIVSFSYMPIRLTSLAGMLVALVGFSYAAVIFTSYIVYGNHVEGWSSLMVVLLVLGGLQLQTLGVLGEYTWRALDESRSRPRFLIESANGPAASRVDGGEAWVGGSSAERFPIAP